MELLVEDTTPLGKKLTITIPKEEVQQEYGKVVQKTKNNASIPGFRPGKAPKSYIEKRWKESFKAEAMEILVPKYVEQALKEKSLKPAYRPQFKGDLKLETDQPFIFSVEFEVVPVPESSFEDMFSLEKKVLAVEDKEIDEAIETLRKQFGSYEDADKSAEIGDRVQLEFFPEGIQDINAAISAEPKQDQMFPNILSEKDSTTKIHKACLGKKKGELVEVSMTLNPSEENKTDQFLVRSVQKLVLAELNEDFFKKFTETYKPKETVSNLAELKSFALNDLKKDKQMKALDEAVTSLRDQLYEKLDFEVPQKSLEHRAHTLAHQYEHDARTKAGESNHHKDHEDHSHGEEYQKFHEKAEKDARKELQKLYFIDHIFDREKLKLDFRQINRDFAVHCYYMRQDPKTFLDTKEGGYLFDYLEATAREKTVLTYLITKKYGEEFLSFST